MASKADTWRRLHRLFRSPDTAYTQAIGEPEYAHTWTTDRYAIVSHYAASLPAVEPGAWKLRATQEPLPQPPELAAVPPVRWYEQRLADLDSLAFKPVIVSPWSWNDSESTLRLIVRDGQIAGWVHDQMMTGWLALPARGDDLRFELSTDSKVVRVTLIHRSYGTETKQLLGYLMTVRMDGAPAFPG